MFALSLKGKEKKDASSHLSDQVSPSPLRSPIGTVCVCLCVCVCVCVCVCEREREGDREIERQETDVCPVTEGQGEKGCKQSPVRSGESISPTPACR